MRTWTSWDLSNIIVRVGPQWTRKPINFHIWCLMGKNKGHMTLWVHVRAGTIRRRRAPVNKKLGVGSLRYDCFCYKCVRTGTWWTSIWCFMLENKVTWPYSAYMYVLGQQYMFVRIGPKWSINLGVHWDMKVFVISVRTGTCWTSLWCFMRKNKGRITFWVHVRAGTIVTYFYASGMMKQETWWTSICDISCAKIKVAWPSEYMYVLGHH